MATAERPVVWLIDEDLAALKTYSSILQQKLGPDLEVRPLQALQHLADYLSPLHDPRTATVIVDQRLKDTGVADHLGIDLAQSLRAAYPKLPIYILTNFADEEGEFDAGEWSIENVIAKEALADPEKARVAVARIRRHIGVYRDILGQREQRFSDLLRRSLRNELAPADMEELDELGFQRASGTLAEELTRLKQLDELVRAQRRLLDALTDAGDEDDAE